MRFLFYINLQAAHDPWKGLDEYSPSGLKTMNGKQIKQAACIEETVENFLSEDIELEAFSNSRNIIYRFFREYNGVIYAREKRVFVVLRMYDNYDLNNARFIYADFELGTMCANICVDTVIDISSCFF